MADAVTTHLTAQILAYHRAAIHGLAARWHVHGFIGLSLMIDRIMPSRVLQKLRYRVFRLSEVFYEWRFGIVSDMEMLIDELGITDVACHDYLATGYVRFRQVMKHIPIRDGEDVFLDFGSGMGRAVILAATYPFRKVIGVELVKDLHSRATKNVESAIKRLRCRDIELYNADARTFRLPADVTIIYLWNPFSGEVLRQVFANIQQSIIEFPRTVTIAHLSPSDPTCLDLIKEHLPWLRECKRLQLGAKSHAVIYTCGTPEALRASSEPVPQLASAV